MPTFHQIITNTNFCIGLFLNIFLLKIIRKCHKTKIGQYRHILLILTLFNLFYGFLHTFIAPKFYNMDYSAVLWVDKTMLFGCDISDFNVAIFMAVFFLSLAMQSYHFIYRFVHICHPKQNYLFQQLWFALLAAGILLVVTTAWFWLWYVLLGRDEANTEVLEVLFERDLNRSAYICGYCGPVYKLPDANGTLHWNVPHVLGFVIIVGDVILTLLLIMYCGVRMVLALRTSQMSKKTLELQKSLLKLLIVQTIAPVCFSYFPPFVSFTSPLFKSSLSINFTVDLPTFYPVMEPLITIYFVEDYRNYVKHVAHWCLQPFQADGRRITSLNVYGNNDTSTQQSSTPGQPNTTSKY